MILHWFLGMLAFDNLSTFAHVEFCNFIFHLIFSALTGAAIFITSIVLGSVIMFTKVSPMNIGKL